MARVDSGRRLHTATISTSGRARRPGMCRKRVLAPAPMRPTRIFLIAMVTSKEYGEAAGRPLLRGETAITGSQPRNPHGFFYKEKEHAPTCCRRRRLVFGRFR